MGVLTAPLPDQVIDDELGVTVEAHVNELAPNLRIVLVRKYAAIFLETERPQFINGQLTGANIPHLGIKQSGAPFTGQSEQSQNRFLIGSHDTRGCANARAFDPVVNDLNCGLFLDPHFPKGFFLRFREGAIAFVTAVALNSLASVLPEFLHFNQAIVTRHCGALLDFCGEQAHNLIGSLARTLLCARDWPRELLTQRAGPFAFFSRDRFLWLCSEKCSHMVHRRNIFFDCAGNRSAYKFF
jgi:hypothetical protein